MDQETQVLVNKQLSKLPQELQKAISSTYWENSLDQILSPLNISQEKRDAVKKETLLIIYGFDNPLNYIDNLVREVKVDLDTAETIAEEVNLKILQIIDRKAQEYISNSSLPMVESGETVHTVPHQEMAGAILKPEEERKPIEVPKKEINLIKTQPVTNPYKGAVDPYREPLK